MKKIKEYVLSGASWCTDHWLALVILLTVAWSILLMLVAGSWLIGYYANGLYGYRFELGSCWQGVGAVAGGYMSIVGLAKAGWTRANQKLKEYEIDSINNSDRGKMPYDEEVIK